jgi:hypothetical protein
MRAISQLLTTILPQDNLWKGQLFNNWNQIMGTLASRVQLEKIENDTVTLGVSDSVWLQELYLLSTVLINTINQSLDTPRIKKIKFRHATPRTDHAPTVLKKNITHNRQQRPLTAQEQHALHAITDKELSTVLYQFLMRCQTNTN